MRDRFRKGGPADRDEEAGLGVAKRDDEPGRRGARAGYGGAEPCGRWQPADEVRRRVGGKAHCEYQVARGSDGADPCASLLDRLALGRIRRFEGDENHERLAFEEGTRAFERQQDSCAGCRGGTTDLEDSVHEPAGKWQAIGLPVTHAARHS